MTAAITNTTSIPRPILRLAALLLALIASIIIAGSVRDVWRNASASAPATGISDRQPNNETPFIESEWKFDAGEDGMKYWQQRKNGALPNPTQDVIDTGLPIEPTPNAAGFRTSNGLMRSKQP